MIGIPPKCHSTPTPGQPKSKQILKHIVSGHINTTDKREGKSKRDTYRNLSLNLVKRAKEIEQTTECVVKLEILPSWARGISRQYKSEKFEATKNSSNETLTESSYHETPKKKLKTDAPTTIADINICQLCKIVFESKEDIATDSPWINLGENRAVGGSIQDVLVSL